LESILGQKGEFYLDLIIMDGNSKDDTVNLIMEMHSSILSGQKVHSDKNLDFYVNPSISCKGVSLRWKSEPDLGQADAINKGFELACGEIIAWLNSDDLYSSNNTIEIVNNFFLEQESAYFVYGKGYTLNKKGDITGKESYVVDSSIENIKEIDYILQPAAFWRAEIYRKIGKLNINYNYVLDWDYWIRISKEYKLYFIDVYLSCNRIYPETKTSSGSMNRYIEIVDFLSKNQSLTEKSLKSYIIYPEIYKELNFVLRFLVRLSKAIKEKGWRRTASSGIQRIYRSIRSGSSSDLS
jgi:glycosyltransferase involved in cell wall biosynthesis